jgi:hypothetical protein
MMIAKIINKDPADKAGFFYALLGNTDNTDETDAHSFVGVIHKSVSSVFH